MLFCWGQLRLENGNVHVLMLLWKGSEEGGSGLHFLSGSMALPRTNHGKGRVGGPLVISRGLPEETWDGRAHKVPGVAAVDVLSVRVEYLTVPRWLFFWDSFKFSKRSSNQRQPLPSAHVSANCFPAFMRVFF